MRNYDFKYIKRVSKSYVCITKTKWFNIDARLIHEATIGKIAGEQLIKLMTLGLSKKKAEETIINGFLK